MLCFSSVLRMLCRHYTKRASNSQWLNVISAISSPSASILIIIIIIIVIVIVITVSKFSNLIGHQQA